MRATVYRWALWAVRMHPQNGDLLCSLQLPVGEGRAVSGGAQVGTDSATTRERCQALQRLWHCMGRLPRSAGQAPGVSMCALRRLEPLSVVGTVHVSAGAAGRVYYRIPGALSARGLVVVLATGDWCCVCIRIFGHAYRTINQKPSKQGVSCGIAVAEAG